MSPDDGNFPGTKEFRRARAQQAGRPDPELEHAYGASTLRPPRVRLYLVAFKEGESFDGEHVDTDGLSLREFLPGLATDKRRRWLAARIVEAHARLTARIGTPESADQG